MDKPTVLICSHQVDWADDVKRALGDTINVKIKCGDLSQPDLVGDNERLAPDVVVWRFDGGQPIRKLSYLEKIRWGLGTKFVLVRYRHGRVPWAHVLLRNLWDISDLVRFWVGRITGRQYLPAPLLPPGAAIDEVAKAVEQAVASCWWTLLAALDFPACQVSPGGRILRANRAMTEAFGPAVTGSYFRMSVENATTAADLEFHDSHPIRRALTEGRACQDFIECKKGQFQLVCLPESIDDQILELDPNASPRRTVSVLIPDSGSRGRLFNFANSPSNLDTIQDIYRYIVDCAAKLGYERVRLYELDRERNAFRGVASRGFLSKDKERDFETNFSILIAEDDPSGDTLRHRIPALCVVGEIDPLSASPRELLRYYLTRNYREQLELAGVNRWIDAPLIVPGKTSDGGPAVLGKLVVDRGKESDRRLSIRDALDVGLLAMMAAGAIHAFRETFHERKLKRKQQFLNELLEVLPLFAFERDHTKFFRAIATILSCDAGLRWEQVLLFVVDSSGLRQASCEMALGGVGEQNDHDLRMFLESRRWSLRDYVEDALEHPVPLGDRLYENWVRTTAPHRTISFAPHQLDDANPVPSLLARPSQRAPYLLLDVGSDPWCRTVNRDVPNTFAGRRVYAFPLTNAFALNVELFTPDSRRTQPVGVALLGVTSRPAEPQELDLELTRVALDLIGSLIAQRWTGERVWGALGAMNTIHGSALRDTWDRVRDTVERIEADLARLAHENDEFSMAHNEMVAAYRDAEAAHDEHVSRVLLEKATLKKLRPPSGEALDFGEFLAENRIHWSNEWTRTPDEARLILDAPSPASPLLVPCSRLVLRDVFTCLLENAVQVATERGRKEVRVSIRSREAQDDQRRTFVEITVADDAGGVSPEDEPRLFLKGFSKRSGGTGLGLALARQELFMFSGDLRYLTPNGSVGAEGRGATFQLLLLKPEGTDHASRRSTAPAETHAFARG
jgi:hypothetical protein